MSDTLVLNIAIIMATFKMLNTLYQSLLQSILFCINHRLIPRSDSIAASADIVFDIGGSQECSLPKQNTA